MAALLSPEWFETHRRLASELPERPGATARIEYTVAGGLDGDVVFHLVLEDGRLRDVALGPDGDADFAMRFGHGDFVASLTGGFDPVVGFMRGEVKVTGDIGRMLSVLPVMRSEPWRAASASLAAETDS